MILTAVDHVLIDHLITVYKFDEKFWQMVFLYLKRLFDMSIFSKEKADVLHRQTYVVHNYSF